jgi:hypothetical protein
MSDVSTSMSIEGPNTMPLTPSSTTRVASPQPLMLPPSARDSTLAPGDSVSVRADSPHPFMPLSPRTSANILTGTRIHLAEAIQIGQGLCETIRRQETAHQAEQHEHEARREEVEFLEARLADYLPRRRAPEGYERNDLGKARGFLLPTKDDLYVPTYWIKQLPDGRVAGLPAEYSPSQEPYVTEVYAVPEIQDEDDPYPVVPLSPWFVDILKGAAVSYATLQRALLEEDDWTLTAEVARYRDCEHHIQDAELRIRHLHAQKRGFEEAQDACKGRMELARVERKVSDMRSLSGIPVGRKECAGRGVHFRR